MADIATITLQTLYRATATSAPLWSGQSWPAQTINANHGETHRIQVPFMTQITRSFGHYATIENFSIFNLHATSSAEISWQDTAAHLNTQLLRPGRLMAIPDINPGTNLVLHGIGAVIPMLYIIMGT